MTFAEKIEYECKKKNTSINKLCNYIGVDHSNFNYWRKNNIVPQKHLSGVCNFLQVTIDELMFGVDGVSEKKGGISYGVINGDSTLPKEERYIIDVFRSATFLGKAQLISIAQEIKDNGGELKK